MNSISKSMEVRNMVYVKLLYIKYEAWNDRI